MGQTCVAGFDPEFKDNMAAIGLTAPPNLFSSQVSALQTIGQRAGLIETFGMGVTVGELIGASDLTDKLAFAGALYASYYLGGTVGSLMVARDAFYACKAGPGAASHMHQALFASGVALWFKVARLTKLLRERGIDPYQKRAKDKSGLTT